MWWNRIERGLDWLSGLTLKQRGELRELNGTVRRMIEQHADTSAKLIELIEVNKAMASQITRLVALVRNRRPSDELLDISDQLESIAERLATGVSEEE